MTNIIFSPTLQAPITLSNPTASVSLASDQTVVAAQSNPVPTQGVLSLVSTAVRMALAMATQAGSVSVAGLTPSVISRLVTPRSPSVGTLSATGASPTLTVSSGATPLTFPRVMLVGVAGDQSYGCNSANGYTNWLTAAAGNTANTAIQTIGAYDIAILAGAYEGWDSGGLRDRENLTKALAKQSTTYTITKNNSRATLVFYYEIMNATVSTNPYAQWQATVDANNWYLYESSGGVGTKTPAGGGQSFINYSAAWPGSVGSAGIGASICGANYGTTSSGSPTGAQGPARTFGNYASIKLLMRAYTGDTRFSFGAQMGSPSAAGIFLDECFAALDGAGTVPDSSLDGLTLAHGSQQGGGFPGLDTPQSLLARGNHNMFDQLQTMLALANPGKVYYNFANFGQYANKYQFGTSTLTAGLESTLHGGLLESVLGAGSASWECFQTGNPNTGNTNYASGWPNLLANYYQGMDFCQSPKLVGLGTKLPSTDGSQTASWPVGAGTTLTTVTTGTALEYQLMRYGLCTALLDDGYFAPGIAGYDWSTVRWYDEFGDDSLAQVNVKRGYLGTALTARPTSPTWNQGPMGVWSRSFTKGIAIVNPRGNGAQTVALTGTYQALAGTQQPTINNGASISSLNIGDGDGRILLSGLTIDQDWTNRSTAAGVTAAFRFDTLAQAQTWYTPSSSDGYNGLALDTTIKVSSRGCARFDIPKGRSDPTMWGNFGGHNMMGHSFGQFSDLYMQWRYRITPSMISNLNTWSSNWKFFNLYQGTVPCQIMNITGVHPESDQTVYRDCGNQDVKTLTTSAAETGSTPPYLSQQDWALPGGTAREAHGVQSAYPNVNWDFPTNEWLTFYLHVHIDALHGSDTGGNLSTIELWVQRYNTNFWFKIIAWKGNLQYSNGTGDVFDTSLFDNYMTANTGAAPAAASTWITEVIYSTQPIAMPQTFPATP